MTDIVILGGARTAIGTFGGALAATPTHRTRRCCHGRDGAVGHRSRPGRHGRHGPRHQHRAPRYVSEPRRRHGRRSAGDGAQ